MFSIELIKIGFKTMAMLLIVLGLLVLVLYVMKRVMFLRGKTKGELLIKSLSTFYLSQKERIEVIDVSGTMIVLGITPGQISFLTKLDKLNEGNSAAKSVSK